MQRKGAKKQRNEVGKRQAGGAWAYDLPEMPLRLCSFASLRPILTFLLPDHGAVGVDHGAVVGDLEGFLEFGDVD